MCSLFKEQSILSRETIENTFFLFAELRPVFSTETFYPLSSIPQPSVGTRMQCSCLSLQLPCESPFNLVRGLYSLSNLGNAFSPVL